ncbi:MAG TPA: hypothetical protein VGJ20_20125 [Xanthobacteraceae bacterium]|jgi:hypothetical protein
MTNTNKLMLVAASVAALSLASPAFAQSFDPEAGTGNVQTFGYAPDPGSQLRIARHHSGLEAYARIPQAGGNSYARIPQAGDNSYAPWNFDGGTFSYLTHGRL